MNLTAILLKSPLDSKSFLVAMGHWFLKFNQGEAQMETTTGQRPSAENIKAIEDERGVSAVQDEINQELADIRLAAVLNIMEIARSHGDHAVWTADHAAQIRAMMEIADKAVMGSEGVIPQGFGTPVRTSIAAVFVKKARTLARINGAGEPPNGPGGVLGMQGQNGESLGFTAKGQNGDGADHGAPP